MTTYASARPLIRTGDILVFKGRSLFGLLIRFATKSPAAHVALARWDSGRLMVYQSMEGHGVECIPASKQVATEDTVWVLRMPIRTVTEEWATKRFQPVIDTAMVALGDKYSWWSIARIAWRVVRGRLNLKDPKPIQLRQGEFICSEYVGACLAAAGYHVPWDGLGFLAPSDFLADKGLEMVVEITP